jgi:hypothetical protein
MTSVCRTQPRCDKQIDLADPDQSDNVLNLNYTARRPSDSTYAAATPRLWFGGDYVVVAWYAEQHLALRVYSCGGRWSEPYCFELAGVDPQLPSGATSSDADKLQQVRIALGADFFVLHFHNQGNSTDSLCI